MIVTLDSKFMTNIGLVALHELLPKEEFKNFDVHTQKDLHTDLRFVTSEYNEVTPILLRRLGKGKCVRYTTSYGFSGLLSESRQVKTGIDTTTIASQLKVGDTILLGGNHNDTEDLVPVRVTPEFDASEYLFIDEVVAQVLTLVFIFGKPVDSQESDIVLQGVPSAVMSDEVRVFFESHAQVFSVFTSAGVSYSIKISDPDFKRILDVCGSLDRGYLPDWVSKSPKYVGSKFIDLYIRLKGDYDQVYGAKDLLSGIQSYLMMRFGIITKLDGKLDIGMSKEDFVKISKNLVDDKRTMSDINTNLSDRLVRVNEFLSYFPDKIAKVDVVDRELFDLEFEREATAITGEVI